MAMLAELVDGGIGVDTHRDTLTPAAVTNLGGVLAQTTTSADAAGYQQLLGFAHRHLPGRRCWAVEGAGSFGAGLTAVLQQRGEREARRALLTTRRSATTARVAAVGQLKALLVGAPEESRAELRGQPTSRQVASWAGLRERPTRSLEHRATVQALRATAQRIQFLAAEVDQLQAELTVLVRAAAPGCWKCPASGP